MNIGGEIGGTLNVFFGDIQEYPGQVIACL